VMVRFIDDMPDTKPGLNIPDSSFMVPRLVLIHDAVQQQLTVVCNVDVSATGDHQELYVDAVRRIDEVVRLVRAPLPPSLTREGHRAAKHQFSSNMDQAAFESMVERAKEYILAGDIIQVVLSQRFHAKTSLDAFLLYRSLRHINPSPYLFFLQMDETVLIGSSPEILVRLEDGEIELRPIAGTRQRGATAEEDLALEKEPIAGTRPRGKTEDEDRALAEELLADPKERAEHLMLVDLGRNDVGRVAVGGSVLVDDLLVVERYSHVMHIVSGVRGRLAENRDQFDVLDACFPAGTVSGAPKIRAMEIIDELEPERRGPYAGAVGYFGFSGNMDFCITIRTFVMQGDDLWIQAGAGIVADSVPQKEYEETINKARGLRRAVELAEEGF
jgi:anthranilate synthase component 1